MASENFAIEVIRKNAPPIYIQIDPNTSSREITKDYLFQACQRYDHVSAEEFEEATINVCSSEKQPIPAGSGDSEPLCYFSHRDSASVGYWSNAAVKCLIASYRALLNKFQCPDTMKREAWAMVAAVMKKKGYSVTGSDCDNKMRCLKFRYKVLNDKRKEKGEEVGIRWEHMEDMEELMAGIPADDSFCLDDMSADVAAAMESSKIPPQEDMAGQSSSDTTRSTAPVIRRITLNPGGGDRPELKSKDSVSFAKAIGEDLQSLMGISSFSGPQWTSVAVRKLIGTFKELQEKFQCPDIMKREAWELVADAMTRKGFPVTGWQCDEKMRNLRYRHKKICEKRERGEQARKWEHLIDMDDLVTGISAMEQLSGTLDMSTHTDAHDQSPGRKLPGEQGEELQGNIEEMIQQAVSKATTTAASGWEDKSEKSGGVCAQTGSTKKVPRTGSRLSSPGGHWNVVAVKSLIATCIDLQSKFHSRHLKKKGAWELVAKAMRVKGYDVTGSECDVKMRNMKFRHRRVIEMNQKKGKARKNWQYMKDMDELAAAEQRAETTAEQKVEPAYPIQPKTPPGGSKVDGEDGQQQQGETSENSQPSTSKIQRRRGRKKKSDCAASFAAADCGANEPQIFRARISITGGLSSEGAIQCLISTYKSLREEFNCPKLKKREAWRKVAAVLKKKGYSVTGLQCDNKMRYLRYRHKRRDVRRRKFGSGVLRYWEHMDAMDDLISAEQGGGESTTASTSGAVASDNDSGGEEPWEHSEDMQEGMAEESELAVSKTTATSSTRKLSRNASGDRGWDETSQSSVSSVDRGGHGREDNPPRSSTAAAQWTSRAVKCLIATYKAQRHNFSSPYTKKKQAWHMVAAAMKKKGFYDVTGPLCNDKMRNLKFRHKQIKEKLRREGREGQATWEHMEDMENLENDTTEVTPVALIKVNNADMSSDATDDNDEFEKISQELQEAATRKAADLTREVARRGGGREGEERDDGASDEDPELAAALLGAQWSSASVKCLMSTYKSLQHLFSSEECMKKEAWGRVADIMTRKGYPVTGSQCDDKMRNLKFRHRRIVNRRKEKKKAQIRWEHMEDMDDLMAREARIEPATLDSSQRDSEASGDEVVKEDSWEGSPEQRKKPAAMKYISLENTTIEATVTRQLTGTPVVRLVPLKFTEDINVTRRSLRRRGTPQQVTMEGDVYRRWQQVKRSQGVGTDSEMAAFLLQCYEKSRTDKESSRKCSRCQRLLPQTCGMCGPAQHNTGGQGQSKGHLTPPRTWSLLNAKEGQETQEHESPDSRLSGATSLIQSPDGSMFRDLGKVTSSQSLIRACEDKVYTNLYPVDHTQDGQFSLLTPSKYRALTNPRATSSGPPLESLSEIRMTGEAFPVKLFQVDDLKEVTVGAMFTNCTRESQLVVHPASREQAESTPQEQGSESESIPLPEPDDDDDHEGGGEEEMEAEDIKPLLPETSGNGEEMSGNGEDTSGGGGEESSEGRELDTKEALDISLSMLSRVLHKRPRLRAPRRTWGLPPYLCQQCGESFDKSSNLVRHIYKHTGEYPYPCPECPSGFVTKTELAQHYRRHTGEKPFLCPTCGMAYSRACNLETHLRTHTGDRPYKCGYCTARFTTSSARSRHQRMHTGEKPYVCNQCNSAFQQLNMLKLHQHHHTGIRAHQCHKCGMAFYTRAGLLRHNRKVQCTKR